MLYVKKICVLGSFSVGKTSLISRFVHDKMPGNYKATIGVDISVHTDVVEIAGVPTSFKFVIWDTEGDVIDNATMRSYMDKSSGAIIVGDVTRPETIEKMYEYHDKLIDISPNAKTMSLINKIDLSTASEIKSVLNNLKHPINQLYMLTSAQTGDKVRNAFRHLAYLIIKEEIQQTKQASWKTKHYYNLVRSA